MIGVRYNDFFAPIVKSVQELAEENTNLLAKIEQQNLTINEMIKRLEKLER